VCTHTHTHTHTRRAGCGDLQAQIQTLNLLKLTLISAHREGKQYISTFVIHTHKTKNAHL